MRNCAPEASAHVLGTAQETRIVFAPAWRSGQRKYVQESLGESRPDAAAAAASRSGGGSLETKKLDMKQKKCNQRLT